MIKLTWPKYFLVLLAAGFVSGEIAQWSNVPPIWGIVIGAVIGIGCGYTFGRRLP